MGLFDAIGGGIAALHNTPVQRLSTGEIVGCLLILLIIGGLGAGTLIMLWCSGTCLHGPVCHCKGKP